MGFPKSTVTICPIVFVFASDGRLETLGGFDFSTDEFASPRMLRMELHAHAAGGVAGMVDAGVRAGIAEQLSGLPGLHLTARLRPLMPRLRAPATIVLPMWTVGRVERTGDAATEWERAAARHRSGFGALARLATALADETLESEAESEFRRALAADPMANRMIGDDSRMRSLALDELARGAIRGELPPVLAMLPECFTIDDLRMALARISRTPPEEVESSSNFRRRLHELIGMKVLRPVGVPGQPWVRAGAAVDEDGSRPGRKPQLYTFDAGRWREWLLERAGGPSGLHRRESMALMSRMLVEEGLGEPSASFSPLREPVRQRADFGAHAPIRRQVRRSGSPLDAAALPVEPPSRHERAVERDSQGADSGGAASENAEATRAALAAAEARLAEMSRLLERERSTVADVLGQIRALQRNPTQQPAKD